MPHITGMVLAAKADLSRGGIHGAAGADVLELAFLLNLRFFVGALFGHSDTSTTFRKPGRDLIGERESQLSGGDVPELALLHHLGLLIRTLLWHGLHLPLWNEPSDLFLPSLF